MARARSSAEILVGSTLAGYRVLQVLGSGGTSHVVLGEKSGPKDRVAIKVLRGEHRGRDDLLARFEREATAAARVRHPNVLEVLGVHREGERVTAFATELLVGLDLADTLAVSRALATPRALRIATAAARGLGAAHAASVVHRDVKPENLFLVHASDGREIVKLLDFGVAFVPGDPPFVRDDGSPLVVGTPEYMAPEQAEGAPAHATADVYSLGVVLFEMLAGRVPFVGEYPKIARKHARDPLPPLTAFGSAAPPPKLEAIVRCALEKDPSKRFADGEAMARALSEIA